MNTPKKIPRNFSLWRWVRNFFGISILSGVIIIISASSYVRLNYHQPDIEQKSCAVVFGAAVWRDDIPSHALLDRTMSGINLFKDNKVECLIFSGGDSTYGSHEADVMKKVALQNNIPESAIFLDYFGNNTFATIQNTQTNFAEKSLVFVSNDFHLARIKLIAHRLGVKDFAVHPAHYNRGRYQKDSYFFFREIMGVSFYAFFLWS